MMYAANTAQDMDDADVGLPTTLEQLLQNSSLILVSLGLVVVVFPYFLVALVPIFVIYNVIVRYTRPAQVGHQWLLVELCTLDLS